MQNIKYRFLLRRGQNAKCSNNALGVQCEELEQVPSEDLCRPYIEKALKDLGTGNTR